MPTHYTTAPTLEDAMSGAVIYRGPSMLDGAPIIVIATGLNGKSRNEKTGGLIQTWIIREDVEPHHAVKTGEDASVCGDCPHRGTSCYVKTFQAPLSVWKSFHRGIYPEIALGDLPALFSGRRVRLGAYGDPAAVPLEVWQAVLSEAGPSTGYTHQWRSCDPRFASYVMASCDKPEDYADATARGYRTFRVRLANEPLNEREIVCPASQEAGYRTTCAACVACGGTRAKAKVNVAIVAHGSAPVIRAYERLRSAS